MSENIVNKSVREVFGDENNKDKVIAMLKEIAVGQKIDGFLRFMGAENPSEIAFNFQRQCLYSGDVAKKLYEKHLSNCEQMKQDKCTKTCFDLVKEFAIPNHLRVAMRCLDQQLCDLFDNLTEK